MVFYFKSGLGEPRWYSYPSCKILHSFAEPLVRHVLLTNFSTAVLPLHSCLRLDLENTLQDRNRSLSSNKVLFMRVRK